MAGIVRELVTLWGFDIDKKPLQELDTGINAIKASLKGVGIATAAVSAGIGFLLNEAGKQEQTNVAFNTLLGSAELAQKTIAELQAFAAKTPFTLPGIEMNAKQLLGMGIEVDRLVPTLKALGDVSAGLSVPLERLALNFGQIKAQGKLTGRELRDFAVAGVPLLDVLSKQFGKTKEEVQDLVSSGQVGFEDVEKAFIAMTSTGGRFNDLMMAQSKTLFGLLSNAEDFVILFMRGLGEEILPVAKEVVSETIAWAEANEEIIKSNLKEFLKVLVGFFKDLIRLIMTFKQGMDGIVAVFGGWNNAINLVFKSLTAIMGLGLIAGVGLLAKSVFGLAMAWKAAGIQALFAQVKMAAIPLAIGAVIAAIALLAEDFFAFSQGRDSVFGRLFNGLSEGFDSLGIVAKTIIGVLAIPFRVIFNTFKNIGVMIDVIKGKLSVFEGFKEGFKNIGNIFGFDMENSLSGILGINRASEQIKADNTPVVGLGATPFVSDNPVNQRKETKVTVESTLNLNLEGMNPDQAQDFVTERLRDELGGIYREAVRSGESQVER